MLRTSTSQSPSSTSPVARSGFTVPSGRARTTPVTRTTHSLRTSTDPSTTHWTTPVAVAQVDERQVLAVLAPACHPAADATRSARRASGRSSPHQWVRSPNAGGYSVTVPPEPCGCARRPVSRGTTSCSPAARSRTVAVPSATSCSPTITATRAPERSAAFICAFIDRPSKARSVRSPARRSSAVRSRAAVAVGGVDDEHVERRAGAANTPSASQASSIRSMPEPKPMPGVGGTAELLDQAVVAAAADDRGLRGVERLALELEQWCACSSRGPGRGRGRPRTGCRARSGPAWTRSKWAADASSRTSAMRGASATTAWVSGRLESSTRSGCVSTFSRSSVARSPTRSAQPGLRACRRSAARSSGVPIVLSTSRHARSPRAAR